MSGTGPFPKPPDALSFLCLCGVRLGVVCRVVVSVVDCVFGEVCSLKAVLSRVVSSPLLVPVLSWRPVLSVVVSCARAEGRREGRFTSASCHTIHSVKKQVIASAESNTLSV